MSAQNFTEHYDHYGHYGQYDPYMISWIYNPYTNNLALPVLKNIISNLPKNIKTLESGKEQITVQTKNLSRDDRSYLWSLINQVSEDPIECCLTLDKDHAPVIITEAVDKVKYLISKLTGQKVEYVEIHRFTIFATPFVDASAEYVSTFKINTSNTFLAKQLRKLKIENMNTMTPKTTHYDQVLYKFIPRANDNTPHTLPSNIMSEINSFCPLSDLLPYRILLINNKGKLQCGNYSLFFIYVQQSNSKWHDYESMNYKNVTFISRQIPVEEEELIARAIESLLDSEFQIISLASDLIGYTIPLFRELCEMWEINVLYYDPQTDNWLLDTGDKIQNNWSLVKSVNIWFKDNITLLSRGLLPKHTFTGVWQSAPRKHWPLIAAAIIQTYIDLPYVVDYNQITIHKDLSFTAHIVSYRDAKRLHIDIMKKIKEIDNYSYVVCDNIYQLVVRRWQLHQEGERKLLKMESNLAELKTTDLLPMKLSKGIKSFGLSLNNKFYLIAKRNIDNYKWLDNEYKMSLTSAMTEFLADCSPAISVKESAKELSELLNISYSSTQDGKFCVSNDNLDNYRQIIASTPLQLFPLEAELGLSRYRNSYYGLLGYFDIGPLPGRRKNPPVIDRFSPSEGVIGRNIDNSKQYFIIQTEKDSRPFFSIDISEEEGAVLLEKLQELWDGGMFMTPWGSIYQHRTGWLSYSFRTPYFGLHTASSSKEQASMVQKRLLQL